LFRRRELVSIKLRALRKRIWFKVLDRVERALIDLTIRVVDTVRSSMLAGVLSTLVGKLEEAMEGLLERARKIGRPLAQRLSALAQAWGNERAGDWAREESFAEYLGLRVLNDPTGLYS
jgi:hypothetical protein